MKSTIILLLAVAGIGIGASQASAGDADNLSCITEFADSGATLRDCGRELNYVPVARTKEEVTRTPSSRVEPGRRDGDRQGGGGGQGGGNGGQGGGQGSGNGGSPNN